jgi:arabinan endo-1,5-alpha-L-arabinosidase
MPRYRNPVYPGYFADPFAVRTDGHYFAYGTGAGVDDRVFEVLRSPDLVRWTSVGGALEPVPAELGTDYWAPEVCERDGSWWMYYSVGHGDRGHHLRVGRADAPEGPFRDQGVNLTSHERFAIDPSPFRADDGGWYLYYARDVLEGERVGTMLAVAELPAPLRLGDPEGVLTPTDDWQIYLPQREMYGQVYDWHTLEGPFVRQRGSGFVLTYSGGNWNESGYGVGWAVADHPLGPWLEPPDAPRLLQTVEPHVIGPGHSCIVESPMGEDVIVYHAWDVARTARRLCIDPLVWDEAGRPHVPGPSWEEVELERTASSERS